MGTKRKRQSTKGKKNKNTKQKKGGQPPAKRFKYSEDRKSSYFNPNRLEKKLALEENTEDDENKPKLSKLQQIFQKKLEGAKFRYLNEKLYTTNSDTAYEMFQKEPELFEIYHKGYSDSLKDWPEDPLKKIINFLKKQPKDFVVADFGCGDARLAKSVKQHVHSFDLVATNELVTACNMKNVPLEDGSVDVAVFCLSLMGVDFIDFLVEAHRVLREDGYLYIIEVESRFVSMSKFLNALHLLGFNLERRDKKNGYFLGFLFVKSDRELKRPRIVDTFEILKPCLYKKR